MPVFEEILHPVKPLYSPAQFDICLYKGNNLSVVFPLKVISSQSIALPIV